MSMSKLFKKISAACAAFLLVTTVSSVEANVRGPSVPSERSPDVRGPSVPSERSPVESVVKGKAVQGAVDDAQTKQQRESDIKSRGINKATDSTREDNEEKAAADSLDTTQE